MIQHLRLLSLLPLLPVLARAFVPSSAASLLRSQKLNYADDDDTNIDALDTLNEATIARKFQITLPTLPLIRNVKQRLPLNAVAETVLGTVHKGHFLLPLFYSFFFYFFR